MNMQRFLTAARRALSVVPVIGVLLWGHTSALAQTAAANPPQSTVTIPVSGTVAGSPVSATAASATEAVSFARANVQIDSTLARPEPGSTPVVIVSITFLDASGTGVKSKTKYVADTRLTQIRPLKGTDVIETTFPFAPDRPQGFLESRVGRATFTLTFDTNGVLTGASGAIDTLPL